MEGVLGSTSRSLCPTLSTSALGGPFAESVPDGKQAEAALPLFRRAAQQQIPLSPPLSSTAISRARRCEGICSMLTFHWKESRARHISPLTEGSGEIATRRLKRGVPYRPWLVSNLQATRALSIPVQSSGRSAAYSKVQSGPAIRPRRLASRTTGTREGGVGFKLSRKIAEDTGWCT